MLLGNYAPAINAAWCFRSSSQRTIIQQRRQCLSAHASASPRFRSGQSIGTCSYWWRRACYWSERWTTDRRATKPTGVGTTIFVACSAARSRTSPFPIRSFWTVACRRWFDTSCRNTAWNFTAFAHNARPTRKSERDRRRVGKWENENDFAVRLSFLAQFLKKEEGANHVNRN